MQVPAAARRSAGCRKADVSQVNFLHTPGSLPSHAPLLHNPTFSTSKPPAHRRTPCRRQSRPTASRPAPAASPGRDGWCLAPPAAGARSPGPRPAVLSSRACPSVARPARWAEGGCVGQEEAAAASGEPRSLRLPVPPRPDDARRPTALPARLHQSKKNTLPAPERCRPWTPKPSACRRGKIPAAARGRCDPPASPGAAWSLGLQPTAGPAR